MASSSKVTVEYHDPAGVFPLISAQLRSRLPLRNLHWKSPTRPLRSIETLHVDLVPSKGTAIDSSAPAAATDLSFDGGALRKTTSAASDDSKDAATSSRRHQIPGLRQTPYLKVFVLRCDDSDVYKATSRKQIREWLKENTPPSQNSWTNAQENHDAFEWLILHVVLPNTAAASQPRWSASSRDSGELKEKSSSTSRWPGRSATTILEKLRADFNVVSKNAPDRVAQIRLRPSEVPPDLMPSAMSATLPTYNETALEVRVAWEDVIAKFKTLILMSFNLRVTQYEEDIREKDSQRALPGWNFCTFFLLKEGLLRGFESVGLVEDALVGYDELSVGLDSIISDQAQDDSPGPGSTLLHHTEELGQFLSEIQAGGKEPVLLQENALFFPRPIDAARKSYREMILSSNISVFDFKCYIFSRQMDLLLRMGNPQKLPDGLEAKLSPTGKRHSYQSVSVHEAEDLLALDELCKRALQFISLIARIMRDDLSSQLEGAAAPNRQVIDNLVSSWTFALSQQVLDDTVTKSIPASLAIADLKLPSENTLTVDAAMALEGKIQMPEPKTMIHPARTSSITVPPYNVVPPSGAVVFDSQATSPVLSQPRPAPTTDGYSRADELAAHRGELYLSQRRVIEHMGKKAGWLLGWASLFEGKPAEITFTDISLDDNDKEGSSSTTPTNKQESLNTVGLVHHRLSSAVTSLDDFRELYEALSDLAIKHFMAAGHEKSAERIMSDIAVIKYEQGNYANAAQFFKRVSPVFADSGWGYIEVAMLKMHTHCLIKLGRKREFVDMVLVLLEKAAARSKQSRFQRLVGDAGDQAGTKLRTDIPQWLDEDHVDTRGLMSELISASLQFAEPLRIPMKRFFTDISVDPYIKHLQDRDGMQLQLRFRHLLDDTLKLENIKVKLNSLSGKQSRQVVLVNLEPLESRQGLVKVTVDSDVTAVGMYAVEEITFEAGRLFFYHEPLKQEYSATTLVSTGSRASQIGGLPKRERILLYPRLGAFDAHITAHPSIHIEKPRSIIIVCRAGVADVQKAELRIHAATAGLRLRTGNATIFENQGKIIDRNRPGMIIIDGLAADGTAKIQVPYEQDNPHREISLWLEATYYIAGKAFHFLTESTISVELPLDVNVYDIFKESHLFSRFNVRTASQVPLRLINVELAGSEYFDVKSPGISLAGGLVFLNQPACMTYRISKKERKAATNLKSKDQSATQALGLTIDYSCINEDICDVVEQQFAKDLEQSEVASFARLLVPTLTSRVKKQLKAADCVKMALVDVIDVPPYSAIEWDDHLNHLPATPREEVKQWLQKWHNDNVSLPLPNQCVRQRQIVITVSIPSVQILHTASLDLISPLPGGKTDHNAPIIPLEAPIQARLQIKQTRLWDSNPRPIPLDFVYELSAPESAWLIGGQRRAHFTAAQNTTQTFSVVLVPLRTGHLLLPHLDIRFAGQGSTGVVSELEYQSYGESVQVVADVKGTTVKIDRVGPLGAVSVLGVQGRRVEEEVA